MDYKDIKQYTKDEAIYMLSGDTTIYHEILQEDATLMEMIAKGKPYVELLKYCQNNW